MTKRVCILTLYSGEQDYPYCLKSLEVQSHRDFEHRVIAGLGNHAAHAALYATIAREIDRFDLFLKLDADMVFRSEQSLARMIDEMAAEPECDHATWHVLDFLSETKLRGIHMFSRRVRWPEIVPGMFVDPDPVISGRRVEFSKNRECHVLHAPFPSRQQAFQFGLHRGTKCFATGLAGNGWGMKHFQFKFLCAVWEMFVRTRDETRGMAMLGAEWARKNHSHVVDYRSDAGALRRFEAVREFGYREILRECRPFWTIHRFPQLVRHWAHVKAERIGKRL